MIMRFDLSAFIKKFVTEPFNQKHFGYTDDDIYNKVNEFLTSEKSFLR